MSVRLFSHYAVGALAIATLALTAACSGGNSSRSTPTPTPSSTASASASATSTAAAKEATTEATSTGDAIDQLTKSSNNFVKADYDITYNITTTADGKTSNGVMVVKHKDNKDYLSIGGTISGGESGMFIFIDDGANSYFCSADGSTKMCLKSDSAGGGIGQSITALKPDKLLDTLRDESGSSVSNATGRTIAGHAASCYNVKSGEGNGVICFDKQSNLMLLLDMSGGPDGTQKLEATKVDGAPADSDFKPPYPIQDLGG